MFMRLPMNTAFEPQTERQRTFDRGSPPLYLLPTFDPFIPTRVIYIFLVKTKKQRLSQRVILKCVQDLFLSLLVLFP